ncbi:MAG: DoxX family protein [Rhizomicrobium sp.]
MPRIGIRVYGLAALLLGAVGLWFDDFALVWQPVPADLPGRAVLAYVVAALFVAAGAAINWRRTAMWGAVGLIVLYGLGVLLLHLPQIVSRPQIVVSWSGTAEHVALLVGAAIAFASPSNIAGAARLEAVARAAFGVCLLMFGFVHFYYTRQTAAAVPHYLPPSQLFWAYTTGVAHIAAGLAILSGIQARLAAILLTIMFAGFSLLVHIPLLLGDPSSHLYWTMNAINLGLTGSAWIVAESLHKRPA